MSRLEFSRKTKAARFAHCGGKCEGCGAKLRDGRFAYDHHVPTGWLGGDNSFENCRVLCTGHRSCHQAKTDREAGQKAKSNRVRDKAIKAIGRKGPPMPGTKDSDIKICMDGRVIRRSTGEVLRDRRT